MRQCRGDLDLLRCRRCRNGGLLPAVDTDGRPYGLCVCGAATANLKLRIDHAYDREFRRTWDARVEAISS